MGEVYKNAARTLIWLGEEADDSDMAIDNMESLTKKMLTIENRSSLTITQCLTKYDLPLSDDPIWSAIRVLQMRPWFFRLWTLQEVVLSKESVLLCGSKAIHWDALLALHQASIQKQLINMVTAEADPKTPFKKSQIVLSHVDFLRKLLEMNKITLPILLTLSTDRGYLLSVDRVWALIGMLNKTYQKHIHDAKLVDYSKHALSNYHETFLSIVKFHIKHDTALAIQLIEDNSRTIRNPSLPSWCPDWHTDAGGVPMARWPQALAGIPGGQYRRVAPWMQVSKFCSLELYGLVVDVIERVTISAGQDMLEHRSYPWLCECMDIVRSSSFVSHGVYPDKAVIPPVPASFPDGEPISEQRQRYQQVEEVLKYILYPPGTLLEASPRTILRCNGCKFFRTKASRLGIGPADLKEGDLLCAMYGARTVWALRPLKDSSDGNYTLNAEEHKFELLGSAYTPSLLKSQAWVGTSCEAMRKFKIV